MKTELKEVVPLYYDLMFKYIFGTKENIKYTQNLLESLYDLEENELKGIKVDNSVNLLKENIKLKDYETDIIVTLPNGNLINMEIYTNYTADAEKKSVMYLTTIFSQGLKKGQKYNEMPNVSQINFVKKDRVHNSKNAIRHYLIMDRDNPKDIILGELCLAKPKQTNLESF